MQIGAGRRAVREEQTQQITQSLLGLHAERVVAGSLRMKEGCIGGKTAPVAEIELLQLRKLNRSSRKSLPMLCAQEFP